MTEDSTFDALGDDDVAFGPPAALLFGFERDEGARIEKLLHELGAGEHRAVCCTATMGGLEVAEALDGDDGGALLPVGEVPRVVLLSGLSDRQVGAVLDQWDTTALPRPIFAVATEANLGFSVVGLLAELLAERQSASAE